MLPVAALQATNCSMARDRSNPQQSVLHAPFLTVPPIEIEEVDGAGEGGGEDSFRSSSLDDARRPPVAAREHGGCGPTSQTDHRRRPGTRCLPLKLGNADDESHTPPLA